MLQKSSRLRGLVANRGGLSEGIRFAEDFVSFVIILEFVIILGCSKQKSIPFLHHLFFLLSHQTPLSLRDICKNVVSIFKINFEWTNENILESNFGISAQICKEHHTVLSMALQVKILSQILQDAECC